MKLKTMQWNIGGGMIAEAGTNVTMPSSYSVDGIDTIISVIKEHMPDVVTLQETHTSTDYSQAAMIAKALGYGNWVNDVYAGSHIQPGQRLGQAIISRFAIKDHAFSLFANPSFVTTWEDGTTVSSHDKGCSKCEIELSNSRAISVQTLHSIPLRRYGVPVDDPKAQSVFADMAKTLLSAKAGPGLIQGDFNVDSASLRSTFPALFDNGFAEIVQDYPTTPKLRRYDHVLYRQVELESVATLNEVQTDHYPLVATFEVGD